MANYDFYLAKSKLNLNDPIQGRVGFHFRAEITEDGDKNSPPYLKLDMEQNDQILVEIETVGDKTQYTVSVHLVEITTEEGLPYKDWVFHEKKPLNFDRLVGKIVSHVRKPNGDIETTEHSGDLLYPDMPDEYPVD